jgi:hypothetical protein
VPTDEALLARPLEAALDPAGLPPYVKYLHDDTSAAVAGYVYCNGAFRLWCGPAFAQRFFSAEEANARLARSQVLPAFILGDVLAAKDRAAFYERLAEHMLTRARADGGAEVRMVVEVRAPLSVDLV